jgi:hypothetical protein
MTPLFVTVHNNSSLVTAACLLGASVGIYLFLRGLLLHRRERLIATTPISTVQQASLGRIAVSGLAAGNETITAPITNVDCYCHRTVVWQETRRGSQLHWEIAAEEKSYVRFVLDDSSGKLLIDPEGADLDLHRDYQREFSSPIFSAESPVPQNVRAFLMRHEVAGDKKVRVEEFCVKPKNFLFILGTLAKNAGINAGPQATAEVTAERPAEAQLAPDSGIQELAPSVARPWEDVLSTESMQTQRELVDLTNLLPPPETSHEMTQQGKIAAALQRAGFHLPDMRSLIVESDPAEGRAHIAGSNGTAIDPPKANGSGAVKVKIDAGADEANFPVVVLKGKAGSTYLISWRNRKQVVSSMKWKSASMAWGGPGLTLLSVYLLFAHLGWL